MNGRLAISQEAILRPGSIRVFPSTPPTRIAAQPAGRVFQMPSACRQLPPMCILTSPMAPSSVLLARRQNGRIASAGISAWVNLEKPFLPINVLLTPLLRTDANNKEGKMIYCGNDQFCCEGDFNSGKCACPNKNTTQIRPGKFQGVVLVSTATFTGTSPSMSIATTSANIRPTTAVTTTTDGSGASGTGAPTSTAEPANTPPGGDGKNLALIIGLSVGLGVGLLFLAVLAFVLYRRWRRRQPAPTPAPIEMKPSSTPSVATPAPAAPVEAFMDGDLREDDPDGPRYRNDWGTPRRIDI